MHDRKAQLQQVFIYIMAIIIIGFIALFGYQMIGNVFEKKCSVDQQLFFSSLQRNLDRANRYGTVAESSIIAPCDYYQLCFVDNSFVAEGRELTGALKTKYPLININTKDKLPYNIYLLQPGVGGDTYPLAYDSRITTRDEANPRPGDELLCINSSAGQFTFWLKGLGKEGILLYTSKR